MNTRLIETAFPLKQTSLDSVHEKNVRHGHISTLHIWPARRPLAAARAALIATLLPDPRTPEARRALLERLGGRVKKVEGNVKEETEGGILHWGRESGPGLEWFRQEIRKAYGGRAPRVLDPFAGGGAIPLEAMRLGCEVTAIDINPVAWFILKCTLEYPQKLAGQKRPLPEFARQSREFMETYFKAQGYKKEELQAQLARLGLAEGAAPQFAGMEAADDLPDLDLAWHVRAWGWWVLQRAKADLAHFYPTVADKPTVAYLWARTVTCKNCRATLPLLKTCWLCKKDKKCVMLTMKPYVEGPNGERKGVVFGIEQLSEDKSADQKKKTSDKDLGKGTMSRSGASCPCCGTIMTTEDIRLEGQAGRLGAVMTAVVVDGEHGKEYRLPTAEEIERASEAQTELPRLFADIPFGLPEEPVPQGASRTGGGSPFTTYIYGLTRWCDLFTPRQLLALGTIVKHIRVAPQTAIAESYPHEWAETIEAYLACSLDRFLDFCNCGVQWKLDATTINHSFVRFALPLTWDFAEGNTIGDSAGSFFLCYERIATALDTFYQWHIDAPAPHIIQTSATQKEATGLDLILTDPPYYDAIPYSDLMDFFYVWLRRMLYGESFRFDQAFNNPLSPKWDHENKDGELIDDASRFQGDKTKSKAAYEDGMARAFQACHKQLASDGRLVIVFAHKQPDAWETLVSAIIRAGFIVDGSWPIQTEQASRMRAISSAALSSSVWLVCKKRPETARPGWDNRVLEEMRENITTKLRDFWDAGIRGPDFVWAATGPAMEAYSQYPIVKKANEPGQMMSVSEFLGHVRRMVVDFVVGRVLTQNGDAEEVSGLDDITTYYLLHRNDFKLEETPVGPCILYAVSCGLSDSALADRYDILSRTGGQQASAGDEDEEEAAGEDGESPAEEGTGSKVKLKPWQQRKRAGVNPDTEGHPIPLIDQVHRLMHLWRAGDVKEVDDYLDARGLRRNALFHHLLQALIELAPAGSEERSLLESISNHVAARGVAAMTPLWNIQATDKA